MPILQSLKGDSPISVVEVVVVSLLAALSVPVYHLIRQLLQPYFSALRALPGPKSSSLFFGNLGDIRDSDSGVWHGRMTKQYGPVVAYTELLGSRTLLTMDTKALNHFVTNTTIYERPALIRWMLGPVFGHGILFVEGATHKRQRRLLNPAFSTKNIRVLTEVFISKSQELRDRLVSNLPADTANSSKITIDIHDYLTRITLDIIGLAGFNYSFESLNGSNNEFSRAFSFLFNFLRDLRFSADKFVFQFLKGMFPVLTHINFDKKSRQAEQAQKTVMGLSMQVLREGQKQIAQEEMSAADGKGIGGVQKSNDLLSLMLKANAASSKQMEKGLSNEELAHQVPSFLLAGHETTANSASWTLMELAIHPEIQTRLRNELFSLDVESPTMDQLNSLPYLDAVVREGLRCNPIVPSLDRVAVKDDIVPVETPYVDRYGQTRDYIAVSKGDNIYFPLQLINRSKKIWGDDAEEFNPDRWKSPPKASQSIPAMWGNQFTFSAGPHGCIGFSFAVNELKALLFTLVKAFEFEMAVSVEDLDQSPDVLKRPKLKSEPEKGIQLPMFIRHARAISTL